MAAKAYVAQEQPLDPDLAIIDAHHHLWDRPGNRYLLDEFLDDIAESGHRIVSTVLVESGAFTLDVNGDAQARNEAKMAAQAAAQAVARTGGAVRACATIVGHVDLRGPTVGEAIEALRQAAVGHLRAIRHCGTWDADAAVRGGPPIAPPGLYADSRFRAGLRVLHEQQLAFDAWAYQTQHEEILDLAGAFPDLRIVFNHAGGVLGTGPYVGRSDALYASWLAGMKALADQPNLYVKLGGLGMERSGLPFFKRHQRPTGMELAASWRPWLEAAIGLFGPARCMFESNFPVDRASCSYGALWNAFKIVTADLSSADRQYLFHDAASIFYRFS